MYAKGCTFYSCSRSWSHINITILFGNRRSEQFACERILIRRRRREKGCNSPTMEDARWDFNHFEPFLYCVLRPFCWSVCCASGSAGQKYFCSEYHRQFVPV